MIAKIFHWFLEDFFVCFKGKTLNGKNITGKIISNKIYVEKNFNLVCDDISFFNTADIKPYSYVEMKDYYIEDEENENIKIYTQEDDIKQIQMKNDPIKLNTLYFEIVNKFVKVMIFKNEIFMNRIIGNYNKDDTINILKEIILQVDIIEYDYESYQKIKHHFNSEFLLIKNRECFPYMKDSTEISNTNKITHMNVLYKFIDDNFKKRIP